MSYWTTRLNNYPSGAQYNQRTVPTWDNAPNENGQNDCGPTCLTAQCAYMTGVWIPPDSIKGAILDPRFPGQADDSIKGLTSKTDLQTFAGKYLSCPTSDIFPSASSGADTGSLLNLVWDNTRQGSTVQELCWWNFPKSGYPHWRIAIGLDPTDVYVFDPWTGEIVVETYSQHMAMVHPLNQDNCFSYDRSRDPTLF